MSTISLLRRIAKSSPLLDGIPGTTSARYWFNQATLNDIRHVCVHEEPTWLPVKLKPALGTDVLMRGEGQRDVVCEGFYNDFSHIKPGAKEGFYLIIPGVGVEKVDWVKWWFAMPKKEATP